MKKSKIFLILCGLILTGALIYGSVAGAASIVGSKHDLHAIVGSGTDQVCIFCHSPHNAAATQLVPLWNHASTLASFTPYTSPTLTATGLAQPAGTSKACLSCHDGTVALDNFGGKTTGTTLITGGALLSNDLSNDHPISFTYDAALATADGGLATPVSATFVDAGSKIPLFSTKLECASCHSVHDNANGDFLRVANTGSALCLKCHTK